MWTRTSAPAVPSQGSQPAQASKQSTRRDIAVIGENPERSIVRPVSPRRALGGNPAAGLCHVCHRCELRADRPQPAFARIVLRHETGERDMMEMTRTVGLHGHAGGMRVDPSDGRADERRAFGRIPTLFRRRGGHRRRRHRRAALGEGLVAGWRAIRPGPIRHYTMRTVDPVVLRAARSACARAASFNA